MKKHTTKAARQRQAKLQRSHERRASRVSLADQPGRGFSKRRTSRILASIDGDLAPGRLTRRILARVRYDPESEPRSKAAAWRTQIAWRSQRRRTSSPTPEDLRRIALAESKRERRCQRRLTRGY